MNSNRDDLRREYAVRIFASMLPRHQDNLEMGTQEKAQQLARLSVELAHTLIDEIRRTENKAG